MVTKAENGVTIYTDSQNYSFMSPDVEVIDSTGAGDVFAAAFFVLYYHTNDIELSAELSTKFAAKSVTRGGLRSVPTVSDLDLRSI